MRENARHLHPGQERQFVHTHLKGRIFSAQGVSYLVLQEDDESPDWVRVSTLGPRREVRRMRVTEVERALPMVTGAVS